MKAEPGPGARLSPDLGPDLALATDLVRSAGSLARRMREADATLGVTTKTSVSDVVTDADLAAEAQIVGRLRALRPDDSILGEEGAAHRGGSGRRWVIDPVDGTWNFAQGLSHWCSALALEDDRGVLLGAIHHPQEDLTWAGGPGLGLLRDGVRQPPMPDVALAETGVATYLHPTYLHDPAVRDPWLRAASRSATLRMLGSGSMDLVQVAAGRVGCWFQHSVPDWDWLPGQALVLGAGGAATQVEVNGMVWSIAGAPKAVAEVAAALQGR